MISFYRIQINRTYLDGEYPETHCIYPSRNASNIIYAKKVRDQGSKHWIKHSQGNYNSLGFHFSIFILVCNKLDWTLFFWMFDYFGYLFSHSVFYLVYAFYIFVIGDILHGVIVVEPRDRGVPNTFPSVNKIYLIEISVRGPV